MPTPIPRDPLFDFWSLPLEMAAGAVHLWLGLFSSHPLTRDQRDDKAHGQLVIPDPLRGRDDHDLFA